MEEPILFDTYEKNFNAGYALKANYDRLTKEQQAIVDHLSMVNTENPEVNAFRDGVKEYLFEKNVAPKIHKPDRNASKSKSRGKDKGRGKDIDR
jgi:hypothetical protein